MDSATSTQKLLFESKFLGNFVKVYSNRVEYGVLFNLNTIPIKQIASVNLGMTSWGFMDSSMTIETTGGKKIKIPTLKRKELRDAILAAINQNT